MKSWKIGSSGPQVLAWCIQQSATRKMDAKGKGKGSSLDSATYNPGQQRFTTSAVAADWQ